MAIEIRELIIKGRVDNSSKTGLIRQDGARDINIKRLKAEIMDECLELIKKELDKHNRNW